MDFLSDELERMATNIAQYTGSESEIPLDDIGGLPVHKTEPVLRHARPEKYPKGSSMNVSYLMRLGGPLSTVAQIQVAAGLQTTPAILEGTSDEGEPASFCRLSQEAKRTVEAWLVETGISNRDRPAFIRLSQSAKELSPNSPYPTLSLNTTLPQHRPNNTTTVFHPLQNEWPLVGLLGLSDDEYPILERASVQGGFIRTWGGKYKVIVDGSETVQGWAYCVKTKEHEDILRTYETARYDVVRCRIAIEGKGDVWGCVFRCADERTLIV
ncbi:uncharacterized protein K452DRAFT_304678 [Aplosporella prunicola CBS 121167]|uniref:Gamma-glutamylcyclotransferase AIG2-like domain-containing protein n=1 Tax=Aplosporella prunicola CBS 121167 TaxID=1176127 RepID=A0A6A6BTN5_9PEZI|nr:uncharacterized protein K452DRAFT_304678 [Aplosporella prunicola CBS 121167]KAF2146743.1 hypothetical protein K452DRAFT_304678 [Aplosporella prunicola CBS 121167]